MGLAGGLATNGGSLAALPYVTAPSAALNSPTKTGVLATFQANYTKNSGTGTVTLLDTTQPGYLGSGALKVVTPSDGSQTKTRNSVSPALDITGKQLKCLIWVDNPANNADFKLYLGSDAVGTYTNFGFADLVGSGSSYRPIQGGEWVWITLTWPNDFSITGSPTNVITNVQLVNTANNGATSTMYWGGVYAVPQPAQGYVSICFDDCLKSQYTLAAGLVDPFGFPVTANVIVDLIDMVNFNNVNSPSYMSLQQMRILRDQHGWEFGAHAATSVNHTAGFDTLPDSALLSEIVGVKEWMLQNGFASGADHLALPLGAYTVAQLQTYKKYFRSVRTISQLNANSPRETFPPYDPLRLRAVSVNAANGNTASSSTWITNTTNSKEWLILLFHDVVASGATGLQINTSDFNTILSNISGSSLQVRSIGDMMRTAAP